MYGCYQYHNKVGGESVDNVGLDTEQGSNFMVPVHGENFNMSNAAKASGSHDEQPTRKAAGVWAYVFQIIFQVNLRKTVNKLGSFCVMSLSIFS